MITNCRACGSPRLQAGLSLGAQRLSDFRADPSPSPAYPLDLVRCMYCTLVQLGETVPRELLYTGNYGYRSGVNEGIRADLASVVETALAYAPARARTWLDIASNDGTLLSNVPARFVRVGVDPVAKFADAAREHANRLVVGFFDPAQFGPQSMDVVTSVSMFYDLDDPDEFVAGVAEILSPAGVWVIQQNYLLDMMQQTTFDNVCHEHITYWSLRPLVELLGRHGLEVVAVTRSPVNGGCIRTVVSRRGIRPVDRSVLGLLREEGAAGLNDGTLFRAFEDRTR
ncbi:MAG TPA: methyltransferase domain-containing protein, partial [Rugosimonospora sp.]|nr:methyltransferase domain-containing protein [Rugosimonospora sp.]